MQKIKELLLLVLAVAIVGGGLGFWIYKTGDRDRAFFAKVRETNRERMQIATAWEEDCKKRPGIVVSARGSPRICFAADAILDIEKE